MPREFSIPRAYRSDFVGEIKKKRNSEDQRKQDLTPSVLDFGAVKFKLARFFGFCYGVENAIEIAYKALEENEGRRIFLLSEMIHNPHVNGDLKRRGVKFLMTTTGEEIIPLSEVNKDDIVIIPAFGTTVEMISALKKRGIEVFPYDATCPFVEKVWKRGKQLGEKGFTVVIHGKHWHEETRATFSRIRLDAPSLMVRDRNDTIELCKFIRGERDLKDFHIFFKDKFSNGFDPERDLQRLGVVNQTTMLAEETREISELVCEALEQRFGTENIAAHFADTRDTLCYATSENQRAMRGLVSSEGDLAIVVGGYNSSNTSHLVEICKDQMPVFYIKDADEILDLRRIRHLDPVTKVIKETIDWLPVKSRACPTTVLISAGASCPDSLVEAVIERVKGLFPADLTANNCG